MGNDLSVEEYIASLSEENKEAFLKLRKTIKDNIPAGFEEVIQYKMLSFVVPLQKYKEGYLGDKKTPLPFISIDSKKNGIHFYHLGIYQDTSLLYWFIEEIKKTAKHKIDHGKSCFRFKYIEEIPYNAIKELVKKIKLRDWMEIYQKSRAGKTK